MPYHEVQNEMEVLLRYVIPGITPKRPMGYKSVEDAHWQVVTKCWAKDAQSRPFSKTLADMFTEQVIQDG